MKERDMDIIRELKRDKKKYMKSSHFIIDGWIEFIKIKNKNDKQRKAEKSRVDTIIS